MCNPATVPYTCGCGNEKGFWVNYLEQPKTELDNSHTGGNLDEKSIAIPFGHLPAGSDSLLANGMNSDMKSRLEYIAKRAR